MTTRLIGCFLIMKDACFHRVIYLFQHLHAMWRDVLSVPVQIIQRPIRERCTQSIFTALHAMQTRYSDENSVRLSVRLSHACIVTKR